MRTIQEGGVQTLQGFMVSSKLQLVWEACEWCMQHVCSLNTCTQMHVGANQATSKLQAELGLKYQQQQNEYHIHQTLLLADRHLCCQASQSLMCLAERQTSPCGMSIKRWRKVASRAAFSAPIGLDRSLHLTAVRDLAGAATDVYRHTHDVLLCLQHAGHLPVYMPVTFSSSPVCSGICQIQLLRRVVCQDPWKHRPLRQVIE